MTTTTSQISLQDIVDFNDSPEKFDFYVDGNDRPVKFYDDYGDGGDYFLFGFEFGATRLIRANGECEAHSVFIDLEPVVPFDQVHEAYGAFDRLLEYMESKGYENDQKLRGFCNRWCKFYFDVCTKDANQTGAWDDWELLEGYELQSNSTDSGIVNVGHYMWMRQIPPSQIAVCRK